MVCFGSTFLTSKITGKPQKLTSQDTKHLGSITKETVQPCEFSWNLVITSIKHLINRNTSHIMGFPSGSEVKNPPEMQDMQETWVRSLSREDSLEKKIATHSNILAQEIPWTEEPGGLQYMRSQRVRHDLETNYFADTKN